MDRTLGIFSISALVLVLITAAMVMSPASDGGQAVLTAKDFVSHEATYRFDGMADTLKLDATGTAPGVYEVVCDFTSAHGGYGDRTGAFVTEALTPHRCVIVVTNDRVTSAMMDDTYDMISRRNIR